LDNWCVVPNLWGMAVGRPGVLKTSALEGGLYPLRRIVAEARERYEKELEEYRRGELVAEAQRDATQAKPREGARNGPSADELKALAAAAAEAGEVSGPVQRRYLTNDTTVEKLGELLAENRNGLLVFRDELSGFLRSLDKPGHESDRAFYLEGW